MRNHDDDKHNKHKENIDIMSGELTVTGDDEVHIELPKNPKHVMAIFSGHCEITPCHPHHHDKLKSFECNFHKKHCMVIKWAVANSRKIMWEVVF